MEVLEESHHSGSRRLNDYSAGSHCNGACFPKGLSFIPSLSATRPTDLIDRRHAVRDGTSKHCETGESARALINAGRDANQVLRRKVFYRG